MLELVIYNKSVVWIERGRPPPPAGRGGVFFRQEGHVLECRRGPSRIIPKPFSNGEEKDD